MVVGGWGSSQVLANLEIAEVSGMPYIVVGATNPRITSKRNAWTFRVIPSDRSLVKQLLQVAQAQGHQNLSVIHDSTAYGRGSRDLLLTFLEERGIKPAVVQSYEPTRRDFTRHLQRIKELGPTDALVVFGTLPAVPLIMQQARAMGIKMPFLGTGGLANEALLTLPPDITRETVIAGFFSEDADTESVAWSQRFEREFANAKSPARTVLAAWEYRAIRYIAAPCLQRAGSNKRRLRDCIKNWRGKIFGVKEEAFFDDEGQLVYSPVILTIRNGNFHSHTSKNQ